MTPADRRLSPLMRIPVARRGPGSIADRDYKSETTISEGTLMSSGVEYSTAIVFLCSDCGTAYKAVQKLTESNQLGYFDCSECNSLVHSWDEVYDYSAWSPMFTKRAVRSRHPPKRLKMTRPRRAPPRWTQQEEQQLLEMAKGDMTAAEMARTLERTPGSIYSRLQRLYRRQGS